MRCLCLPSPVGCCSWASRLLPTAAGETLLGVSIGVCSFKLLLLANDETTSNAINQLCQQSNSSGQYSNYTSVLIYDFQVEGIRSLTLYVLTPTDAHERMKILQQISLLGCKSRDGLGIAYTSCNKGVSLGVGTSEAPRCCSLIQHTSACVSQCWGLFDTWKLIKRQ